MSGHTVRIRWMTLVTHETVMKHWQNPYHSSAQSVFIAGCQLPGQALSFASLRNNGWTGGMGSQWELPTAGSGKERNRKSSKSVSTIFGNKKMILAGRGNVSGLSDRNGKTESLYAGAVFATQDERRACL